MYGKLEAEIDRAVERARDRTLAAMCAGGPDCPDCGAEMAEIAPNEFECDCGVKVECFGPEEDAPRGYEIVTRPGEDG